MIGTINIKVNAANPNLPLAKFFAFLASPSNVRVVDVPRKIGKWAITKVFVTANYPDNSSHSVECALDGGCWHATLPASAAVGTSVNGFKVMANGVSEDGSTAVSGYVLGAGDLEILSTDGTITVGETTYYTHLLDTMPATPHKGDLCVIDGVWKIYTGSAWQPLAGGGGDVKRADFAAVDALPEEFTENEMRSKLNTVISILKTGATTLLLSACCLLPGVLFSATVQTALKGDIKNTAPIVTNVTFEGLEPGNYAAVSNAAMTAVQPSALDNYISKSDEERQTVVGQLEAAGFYAPNNSCEFNWIDNPGGMVISGGNSLLIVPGWNSIAISQGGGYYANEYLGDKLDTFLTAESDPVWSANSNNFATALLDAAERTTTSKIDAAKTYQLGDYDVLLSDGQIYSLAPVADMTITLALGNSPTNSADAILWVTNVAADVTFTFAPNTYNFIVKEGGLKATANKRSCFSFVRVNDTDVIVSKEEY